MFMRVNSKCAHHLGLPVNKRGQIHEPSRPIATLKRCRLFDARLALQVL